MWSSLIFMSLGTYAFASPHLERRVCGTDVCLSGLLSASASFSAFCATYTKTVFTATAALPTWASACKSSTSKLSSGCSCAFPATAATVKTTSSVPTTTSSVKTTVSASSVIISTTPSSVKTSSSSTKTDVATGCVRTVAASGAIVVDNSASPISGSYKTMKLGIAALSTTSTTPQTLFIRPGTYTEQVYIPALKSNLTVQGYTTDCSSYPSNTATITYNLALKDVANDDATATVRIWSSNIKLYNINIANTFGHISTNGQNLAVSSYVGNSGFYGVQFLGYQDTILARAGAQLYAKCLIVGAIDFIFGQTALAWFEDVDIRTIAAGSITASGRDTASNPSWFVINNSNIAGINSSIPAASNYLGRPWKAYARVVFQNSYLSSVIKPAGWSIWSAATPNTDNATLAEYGNTGPGSVSQEGPRASFGEQLGAAVAIETVLGVGYKGEWWVDSAFL